MATKEIPGARLEVRTRRASASHLAAVKLFSFCSLLAAVVVAIGLAGYLPRKQREAGRGHAVAHTRRPRCPVVSRRQSASAPRRIPKWFCPAPSPPLSEASIFARAAGYVKKRYVDIGDRVKEGQLHGRNRSPRTRSAGRPGARRCLARPSSNSARPRRRWCRRNRSAISRRSPPNATHNLVAHGAVARQDADTQAANYKTSEALVAAQEANVRAAEENVRAVAGESRRVIALQDYQECARALRRRRHRAQYRRRVADLCHRRRPGHRADHGSRANASAMRCTGWRRSPLSVFWRTCRSPTRPASASACPLT